MSLVRAFIAVKIPSALQEQIHREVKSLRGHLEGTLVRWVPPQNIHLTLKFLGDTPTSRLDLLKENLAAEVAKISPFDIKVRKIGAFPKLSRPSVIWIGVEDNDELFSLQRSIERVASQIGNVPEKRRFSAHLTLGRVTRKGYSKRARVQISKAIEESPVYDFGRVRVDSVHLFESELKPTGAVYRSLFEARLGEFFE
ncbi:MAG: RNA 2',3'-cyclic phosphodiesterase [Anaerolineae bacterium]|jgi:2'-5' RNA ligase|nr:RNA 2',3'-cyclic phosphodiesterase [Anaerolineae bacterium]MBT3713726.1 RNA 2',3'-cyclic phosphodiesterase [Anaerolineae bacterium]MBT4310017.1 RNA 2',3'-cyclic phosphodiesterase [Anaerolineae bacterium]MBT4458005.1 RNA 2',3'-cyclic phosphodiesterase [Anaerolineae bacterium]MBT6060856.1 RNA 2',3'-cyclic phosphodiesterase [Anaerolineae bacterium]